MGSLGQMKPLEGAGSGAYANVLFTVLAFCTW